MEFTREEASRLFQGWCERGTPLVLTFDVEAVTLKGHISQVTVDSLVFFSRAMSITVPFNDVRFEIEELPDRSETVPDPKYTFKLRLHLPAASGSPTGHDPQHYATVMSISERILVSVQ